MSFPGRPPMGMPAGMPGMAPRMMTSGYAFTPMGMPTMNPMMPAMPMGMMAPMMRPMMTTATPITIHQQIPKTDVVLAKVQPIDVKDKPPVTTVFVGNISDRAPDMMIKQMLQRCGNVISWKRVQGASGKLQAFGFCEYEEPEATLRCIRLLNEWSIAEKKLVVKVDAKTKTLLDEYRKKKALKAEADKKSEGTDEEKKDEEKEDKDKKEENEEEKKENTTEKKSEEDDKEPDLDEDTKREDRVAGAGLEAIMREYAFELAKEPMKPTEPVVEKKEPVTKKDKELLLHAKDTGFEDMDLEDEKREIINREINKFRDRHKDDDEDKEKEKDKERDRIIAREREQRRQEEKRVMERLREQREKEFNNRERASTRVSRSRSRSNSRSASPAPSRARRRSRERSREKTSRDRSRERRKEKEVEEEEEKYERRKLEKKLREKEAAYQERLKNWEARERKKAREFEKENEREDEKKTEESREARRLKEFLEDYDDVNDDPKFYKGSALARRLKEREKEKELDNRDRQREKEEFEEIKRKLFEEGHPDAETEVARMEREREEHLQPRLHLHELKQPEQNPSRVETRESESEPDDYRESNKKIHESPKLKNSQAPNPHIAALTQSTDRGRPSPALSTSPISTDSRISAPAPSVSPDSSSLPGLPALSDGKRKKLTVGDVFNQDDDDSNEPKKRKLIPLDYDEDKTSPSDKKAATAEEKRQRIKQLIENIPTAKDELYAFSIDWDIVDQTLMDKRIKPWVTKKIVEYIGEEEPTLTEFICQKVVARSTPQSIQNDVAMILDEEAEVFVVKMWRLLVYETEAKKLGLVK